MKIKELSEELKKFDPELDINVLGRVSIPCSCPDYQEYCYCDGYEEKDFHINRIDKVTEYSKKDKKQIIVGVTLNCS